MSKAAKRFIWLPILLVAIGVAIWAIGCGGGPGMDPGDTPIPTTGTFRLGIVPPQAPPPGQTRELEEDSERVIPWNTHSVKVVLTGEGIKDAAGALTNRTTTYDFADMTLVPGPPVNYTVSITNVPVGFTLAEITLYEEAKGAQATVLAVTRHSFYMVAGDTANTSQTMGVAFTDATVVSPTYLEVMNPTTLIFQNWTSAAVPFRLAKPTAGQYSPADVTNIAAVIPAVQPHTPAIYDNTMTVEMNEQGDWIYDSPGAVPGTSYIHVYDQATVTSAWLTSNSNYTTVTHDNNNEQTGPIYLRINGTNLGVDQDLNGGSVKLYKSVAGAPPTASLVGAPTTFTYAAWTNTHINVQIGTDNGTGIDGGKYFVVVEKMGNNFPAFDPLALNWSGYVYVYKGSGSYGVVVE
jgi:hypothetical protein